jgi:hypothetical protein
MTLVMVTGKESEDSGGGGVVPSTLFKIKNIAMYELRFRIPVNSIDNFRNEGAVSKWQVLFSSPAAVDVLTALAEKVHGFAEDIRDGEGRVEVLEWEVVKLKGSLGPGGSCDTIVVNCRISIAWRFLEGIFSGRVK